MTEEQSLEEKEEQYFNMLESVTITASEVLGEIKEAAQEAKEDAEKMLSHYVGQISDRARQINNNERAIRATGETILSLVGLFALVLIVQTFGIILWTYDAEYGVVVSLVTILLVGLSVYKLMGQYSKIVRHFGA